MPLPIDLGRLSPLRATVDLWVLWVASWMAAAIWARRTVSRPVGRWAYYAPTLLGTWLLFPVNLVPRLHLKADGMGHRFWSLSPTVGWILCGATAVGFGFAWWARLHLGRLWSGTITFKEGHRVVDTGPYGLVRHPIYTGLIAAGFALAAELGTPAALLGGALMALGWWMKAREEERFLSDQLGTTYDDFRRRTPMLIPFARAWRLARTGAAQRGGEKG